MLEILSRRESHMTDEIQDVQKGNPNLAHQSSMCLYRRKVLTGMFFSHLE